MPITIKGRENGPYMVPCQSEYISVDGQEQTTKGSTISLCRCGGSSKKPFCDGTHRRIEFQAPFVELTLPQEERA
jgi:CDGSH-type Zn-finger protein